MSAPIWLELVKAGVTVGATLVAAWWARQIGRSQRDIAQKRAETASRQRKVAEAKLNLDLFKERYELFEKVWAFLSAHVIGDPKDQPVWPSQFNSLIPKAQFLFGKRIADYMRDVSEKHVQWAVAHQAVRERPSNIATPEESKAITEGTSWFKSEADECFKRFADYLDFSAWKIDPLDRVFNPNAA